MSNYNLSVLKCLMEKGSEVEIEACDQSTFVGVIDEIRNDCLILDETTAFGDMVVIYFNEIKSFSVQIN